MEYEIESGRKVGHPETWALTLQRAGRLIRPQGILTLSMSANEPFKNRINGILDKLDAAA
jgi:hypothetical protein